MIVNNGYKYTTNNKRGNNYRLIITEIPVTTVNYDNFRNICINYLGTSKNIDFNKLALVLCFMQYDTRFIDLTFEQMERRIKDKGFVVSR